MTSFQVSMCVCICVRYGVSVEVRGQLAGVRSLLAPCGSWGLNSDSQAPFPPEPSHCPKNGWLPFK